MNDNFYLLLTEHYCSEFEKNISYTDKIILSKELEVLDKSGTNAVILKYHASVFLGANFYHKTEKIAIALGIKVTK